MAVEVTPLGFQKPDGSELLRNGDNVIAANGAKAEELHQDARGRLTVIEAKNAVQDGRLTAGEAKDVTQDGTLATHAARLANLDNAAGFTGDPLALNDVAFAETLTNGTATAAALDTRLTARVPPIVAAAIASDPTVASSAATMAQNTAGLVPVWKVSTAYVAGQRVIAPNGDVVSAKVNFTSGATYSATNWNASTQDGRIATLEGNAWDKGVTTADLNTILASGERTINTTSILNLPVALAGNVDVHAGSTTVLQKFTTRETVPRMYFRRYIIATTTWEAWSKGEAGTRLDSLEANAWDKGVTAADLNTILTTGSRTVNSTGTANLPVALAGNVDVHAGSTTVLQKFTTRETSPRVFYRRYVISTTTWEAWGPGRVLAGTRVTTEDLNATTTPGTYYQTDAAQATPARNYPFARAGSVVVTPWSGDNSNVTQMMIPGTNWENSFAIRSLYSGAWSPWDYYVSDADNVAKFAAKVHTHAQSDITGLAAALAEMVPATDPRLTDARTPLAHTHTVADITDIGTEYATKEELADVIAGDQVAATDVSVTALLNDEESTTSIKLATLYQPDNAARPVGQGELILSVKESGATGGGTTDDTTAVLAAISSADTFGAVLLWPVGAFKVTANLPGLHAVRHVGPGRIVRDGVSFYVSPRETQKNIIRVSPAGSDANDGLTTALPKATFQSAFDAVDNYGPILDGLWEVNAAAGTYPSVTVATFGTASKNQVSIKGPSVGGHPNVPTAIIDGAGGAAYSHGLRASGSGVKAYFWDFLGINFNNGGGDTTRIPFIAENRANLQTSNVHTTSASWTGIYAFNAENARIFGGIHTGCRSGVTLNATHGTVGSSAAPVIIRNSTESGLYWSRGSQGHADYVTFEDNMLGLSVDQNSRVHAASCNFKRNATALKTASGGTVTQTSNAYNTGGADANTVDTQFYAYSGDNAETNGARSVLRIAADYTDRVSVSSVAYQALATPYTIPAGRLVGAGKSLRVHVTGHYAKITAGSTFRVDIGGQQIPFTIPTAGTDNYFELDVTLRANSDGGYVGIGKIMQALQSPRYTKRTASFVPTSSQAVVVNVLLTALDDVVTLLSTEVYITG